jgi:integrase
MPKLRFTPQFVKTAICEQGKRKTLYFDIDCKWLILEVRSSQTATYYLRYQGVRGTTRLLKIGDSRDLSLAQARQMADKYRSMIAMGEDPASERSELKQVPTVYDFIHKSYLPFVEGYKRSWKCDLGLLRKHIEPVWGKKYLDQITKADIISLFAKHRTTHAPGSCNRLLILLRYMFSLAKKWEIPAIKSNPTEGIPLMKENNKRERYLSSEEAQVLYEELKRSDNKMLQYIVPMLILTGARKREVLDARWEDFDFERKSWRIHTTKLGRPRHVPLSDGVISLLESIPRFDCEWVLPNPKTLKPYVQVFYSWDTARKAVGLDEVRMHDLRHSFASFLVNSGRTLYEVQRLLGHTQIKTTQRYAHLSPDTLLDASNAASRAVGNIFLPAPSSPLGARLLSVAA